MSLQTKVSVVILLIVGLSALADEYIDRQYVAPLARQNFQEELAAVVRQIGAGITAAADFLDQPTREMELAHLLATRPDLIDVALYAFTAEDPEHLRLLASAGNTTLPGLEQFPLLVTKALTLGTTISDAERDSHHRLAVASPITVDGRLLGAAFAEFSTAQFDEVLEYQHRLSLMRRIGTGALLVLTINLFLYWYVHRPVGSLLSAVKAVTEGSMTTTVPVRGQDEIGTLASRFNVMVNRIRSTGEDNARLFEALQQAHRGLQMKVEEATAEIREKNRELARSNELLSSAQREAARAQRLSAIGQLAASVAHKIGTPLTALSGHIQLLQEDPQLTPDARRRLVTVEGQIEQTGRIIQDLLIYGRKPEPVFAPLDVAICLEDCLALLRPEIGRRGVTLVTDYGLEPAKTKGDHQQLQEVFCNLIDNALDAMPEGGQLTIRTYHLPAVDETQPTLNAVEIRDTGQGIAADLKDQIFQPFFTTKKSGQGTGLGLAIAVDTVRAHGGTITVASHVGKGSCFTVLLPNSEGHAYAAR
jgi:two-component system NtrC family sensor kinase